MIFKCKICGGSLDVNIGERTAICEYCGVEQTIPSFIDIKAQEIYNIANNYLAHNEFDKAENLYAQILIDNKSDADAYWNILMCRYGVTYVKDPATEKYIPTCNRTLYAPIFNDENYKNAIKYADEKQRVLFEANARIIDDIQKGILSVSRKEKPFDIFISYKETDANGARTKDSITAQDLYEKLTAEGYKVFFSRITLEDKIGTEYEPYIYAALASSKVMITVSSSKENLESVWVKNEWSRFLSFMGKDSEKTLVPLYIDMDKSDMPDDFVHMPSYDMKTDGFEQDLIRGIKKLIPLPVMLLERRKKRNKILKRVGIAAAVCAVICVICAIPWFMKLPDYNAAMQLYYDKNYPEATWAFADLGQYRNSDKMKEKCELSWRKSLASIVAVPYELSYSDNIYYITDLGSVKQYNNNGKIDNSVNDLSINEHGRIASLAWGYEPHALYEDGTAMLGQSEEEWKDIVQIVGPQPIGLRSDGRVIYSKTKLSTATQNEDWLKDTENWTNIVSLEYYGQPGGAQFLIGVTSNGTVCKVQTEHAGELFVDDFKNVKTCLMTDFNICAITYDDKIICENNGSNIEYKTDKIKAAEIHGAFYDKSKHYLELLKNGELYIDDKYVLGDICYLKNGYALSKTGVLYSYDLYTNTFTEFKKNVLVNDEWK
ncbi:MAG: toll/interleukin-1 receptor domain-containing protein [Clostridia bacterium]|nr:toll/interleukin-1 receptor domain-containing protein [Clostridia bacterium]